MQDFYTVESLDSTPLTFLTQNGYDDIAKELIEKDFDINARDKDQYAIIHMAIYKNNIELLNYLINTRDDLDLNLLEPRWYTPLYISREFSRPEIEKILLKNGAVLYNDKF